jgi:hypothetical protein
MRDSCRFPGVYNPVQSLLVESSSSKDAKDATTGDAGDDANAPWGVHEKNKRSKDAWQETLALRTVGKLRYDEKLKAPNEERFAVQTYCSH